MPSLAAWQWAWDRHGARYSWAVFAIVYLAQAPVWIATALVIVAFEDSHRYVVAAAVAVVGVAALVYVTILPGLSGLRLAERWAIGDEDDVASALEATYTSARRGLIPTLVGEAVWASCSRSTAAPKR